MAPVTLVRGMVENIRVLLANDSTIDELFKEYTRLDTEADKEAFVLAVLGELAISRGRQAAVRN